MLVALTDKSSMPYFLYERTMAASQSAMATSPTSVRQFQTDVGTRQQKDKELAKAHKKWTQNMYTVPQTILACFYS